jgi:hypothetical protein
MSYDENDAAYDGMVDSMYQQFIEDPSTHEHFYQELYDEIVKDFTEARLRSFFEAEPLVAAPAVAALADARRFQGNHDTAAFLFGAIATEVGLRTTLQKPIVYGLVHAESAAGLIARILFARSDERLTKLMLDLLASHGGVDLRTHARPGSAKSIWEEISSVREKRNQVVHRAVPASAADADLAIAVSTCILDELFPSLVARLGMRFMAGRVGYSTPSSVKGDGIPY